MRLDQRLRLLRGEAAAQPPDPVPGDLAGRLRRLAPSARLSARSKTPDEQALADALGAEPLAPGVLRIQSHFRHDYYHGRSRLGDCLSALPDLTEEPAGHPGGWLFLDTETSGLAGGTGTWVFLFGLMCFEVDGLLARQYLLTRLDAEPSYLEAIVSELHTAKLLVTYNGKSFDGPLLATRFRLSGLSNVLNDKLHLDLLRPVRRAFTRAWPDCRLATAERRLLGFARKDDLSGAEAPAAWLSWLRQGNVEGLTAVMRHNQWDLLSLPALVPFLRLSLVDPAATGADVHAVARFHLSRGDTDRALALLLANRDRLAPPALLDLARLHRRRGEWSAAGAIWESLAEEGIPEALEARAKLLEHRERNYERALACADRLPVGPARSHRRRRLVEKLGWLKANDDDCRY